MKLVRKAVRWYSERLFTTRMDESIIVHVKFTKDLHKRYKSLGSCGPKEIVDRPKEFDIEIDADLSQRRVLQTIAHELVHVRQYATGHLKEYNRNCDVKWKGERFEEKQTSGDEYWFTPWEIEAYGVEVGLYTLLKKHLRKERRKMKK